MPKISWMTTLKEENERLKRELDDSKRDVTVKQAGAAHPLASRPADPAGGGEPFPESAEAEAEKPEVAADEIEAAIARGKKMAPTKPWEKKDTAKPWRMDVLKVGARPGFVARWVHKDMIERRMQIGYNVANRKDYEIFQNPLKMGSSTASYVSRGELVLMEIPIEGKKAREKMSEDRIKAAQDDAKKRVREQAKDLAREIGVETVEVFDESSRG